MDRQQLFQMFAQRMNLRPEEAEALQNGDFEQAFKTRAQGDPLLMSMVNMMQKNREAEDAEPEPPRRPSRRPDDELEDMREALRAARTVLRYLAQVMGACGCWGRSRSCPRCHGEGAPGFRESTDPETFLAWVRPGVEALGYRLKAPSRFVANHAEQPIQEK